MAGTAYDFCSNLVSMNGQPPDFDESTLDIGPPSVSAALEAYPRQVRFGFRGRRLPHGDDDDATVSGKRNPADSWRQPRRTAAMRRAFILRDVVCLSSRPCGPTGSCLSCADV